MSCRMGMSSCSASMSKRIVLFDALRGLSILLMLVHHFAIDLIGIGVLPHWLVDNPIVDVLWFIFASTFILLCGFSSEFARDNRKRGVVILIFAYALTLVTGLIPGAHIRFGILHLLGFCILIDSFFAPHLRKVSYRVWYFLFALGYVFYIVVNAGFWTNPDHLWMLGIVGGNFASADYFPLMPWFFLFELGTNLGVAAKEERLPEWVYRCRSKVLAAIGRHTLIIYLLHQPIFYGVLSLLGLYKF